MLAMAGYVTVNFRTEETAVNHERCPAQAKDVYRRYVITNTFQRLWMWSQCGSVSENGTKQNGSRVS